MGIWDSKYGINIPIYTSRDHSNFESNMDDFTSKFRDQVQEHVRGHWLVRVFVEPVPILLFADATDTGSCCGIHVQGRTKTLGPRAKGSRGVLSLSLSPPFP